MASIPLYRRGEVAAHALVDDPDVAALERFRWHLDARGYAIRGYRKTEQRNKSTVQMGRQILGLEPGDRRQADHINRDPLDNRRSNLRVVSNAENGQNRGHPGGSSTHRGVTRHLGGKWQASAKLEGRAHHIGLFDDELAAAKAAADFRRQHMPCSDDAALVGSQDERAAG